MTVPTWFAKNGYVTAGNGKVFHPDGCNTMHRPEYPRFAHEVYGDDPRAWNYGEYGVEGLLQAPFDNVTTQFSEEQWGVIPGPHWTANDSPMGVDWLKSPLTDEEQTDGQLATSTVQRLANFSKVGIGKGSGKPFFLATGFHKPHSPWIVPEKYFDLYDADSISLPPNPNVPANFLEENWHVNGNVEVSKYTNPGAAGAAPFNASAGFAFHHHVDNVTTRELRHAYFAATSFIDAQVGRVLDALESEGYADNTVVALWSDHGYHLGDTNSWCKMTNFEKATRNTLFWRVPGQTAASQGLNTRYVEMIDFFPTAIELMGLPAIPACQGIDQPPTVQCLQGVSYASEFVPPSAAGGAAAAAAEATPADAPKQYIFSQWPYPKKQSPGANVNRMGYSVRTADGFRLTQYVPYSDFEHRGVWNKPPAATDLELYVYSVDPHETVNQAGNSTYANVVTRLAAVLRAQFDQGQGPAGE